MTEIKPTFGFEGDKKQEKKLGNQGINNEMKKPKPIDFNTLTEGDKFISLNHGNEMIHFNLYEDKELGFGCLREIMIPQTADEDTKTTTDVLDRGIKQCIKDFREAVEMNRQKQTNIQLISKAKSLR